MRTLAQLFFKLFFGPLVHLVYRVRKTGRGYMPREGGVLLLSNHVSYIDSFILYLSSPRPVRFVVLEAYVQARVIGWFLKLFRAIPIRPRNAREALTRTIEALEEGDVVCLFPEGGLTRTGVIGEFKKGFEMIVRRSGCQVVPVYMDGLWNSIFSFERGRYFKKRPNGWTCPLQVAFGRPIEPGDATVEAVREAVLAQSVEAFARRREFSRPLEKELVKSLKRKRRAPFLVEYGKSGVRKWSRGYTLGLAAAIARRWMDRPENEGDRVGILLPPGPMTSVINLGLFLAGKTPVNLPFTLDQEKTEAVAKSIAPLGIRTVITSRAFMPQLMDYWIGDEVVFVDLKSVVTSPGAGMVLFERLRAILEPAWVTCWRLDLNRREPDREAVGLVRHPGREPVLLSALELHRNARQVTAANFVQRDEIVFNEEGLSTPAGLLAGCWSPALSRGRVVSRSFSLREQFEPLEKAILEEEVTVVIGTARFYAAIEAPLSIRSLRYGILFGKVNQWEIRDWEKALDLPLARAWDMAGRVVTMSRTDPERPGHADQAGRHPKSVGRFLPGIAARTEHDRLLLRFEPLGEGETEGEWIEGPRDVEIDADGFLYLLGADLEGTA